MRRKWRKAKPKETKINFITGDRIKSEQVFLIDETGAQTGNMLTSEALERAKELSLTLVLVNPKKEPPVAKIVDLGQLKYEADKKAHKQKMQQKKTDTKEIRLSARISEHDFNFRINQAIKFVEKDSKIKLDLILKGRERQHPGKAFEVMNEFSRKLNETEGFNIIQEQPLTKQGGRFTMILMNKK